MVRVGFCLVQCSESILRVRKVYFEHTSAESASSCPSSNRILSAWLLCKPPTTLRWTCEVPTLNLCSNVAPTAKAGSTTCMPFSTVNLSTYRIDNNVVKSGYSMFPERQKCLIPLGPSFFLNPLTMESYCLFQ